MTIIEKMYAGVELTEKELKALTWGEAGDEYKIITELEGECSRWTRAVDTIIKVGEDYWDIPWERGLTEYQDNEFWEQPFRVKPVEKTIKITEWVALEDANE